MRKDLLNHGALSSKIVPETFTICQAALKLFWLLLVSWCGLCWLVFSFCQPYCVCGLDKNCWVKDLLFLPCSQNMTSSSAVVSIWWCCCISVSRGSRMFWERSMQLGWERKHTHVQTHTRFTRSAISVWRLIALLTLADLFFCFLSVRSSCLHTLNDKGSKSILIYTIWNCWIVE